MSIKRVMCMGVLALFCFALGRAAMFRFQEKEDAIFKACREELQKLGMTRDAAKTKYPTPEIHMVSSGCLQPGGAGDVVVKGKFAPGTKFIFENDNLEVVKESLVGGEYRATLKAAPGIGPQTAAVMAITPVTGLAVRQDRAAVVGGRYEWNMAGANGWKIVARSSGAKACGERGSDDPYEVLFYRPGQASPFEKRTATLYHSLYERTNYRFNISQQDDAGPGGAQDMQALMQKMMNPNLTEAQRDAVIKDLEKMQTQMQANMAKMADPAYAKGLEAKRLEFGCERLEMAVQAGNFSGEMRCSQKVGARISLTGTMQLLAR